jgi:drug/metabolite transporter (DMT)-like permease
METFGVSTRVLGLVLASFAAWCASTGLALQRSAELEAKKVGKGKKKTGFGSYKGAVGFLMNLGSQPLNIVALTYCSPAVQTALTSSVNILNSIFISTIFLGDLFTTTTFLATVLGVCGAVGIVSVAPVSTPQGELARTLRLLSFWQHPRLAGYIGALVALCTFCAYHIFIVKRNKNAKQSAVLAFAYPFLGACLSRFSEFSFKCIGQLLINGFEFALQEKFVQFGLAFFCAGFFGPVSMLATNYGARQQDAKIYIPALTALGNIISASYSIALGEFDNEPAEDLLIYLGLVAVLLFSVYFSAQTVTGPSAKDTKKKKA